ncbi:MAG: hypothetical protein OHK0029_15900 [Armatimonadaceae bacterium]
MRCSTKGIAALAVACLCLAGGSEATAQTIVARQDFDSPVNLISTDSNIAFNSFSDPQDAFGVYQRGVTPSISQSLLDDSLITGDNSPNPEQPEDNFGIIKSTKLDAFFGIVDVVNSNTNGSF